MAAAVNVSIHFFLDANDVRPLVDAALALIPEDSHPDEVLISTAERERCCTIAVCIGRQFLRRDDVVVRTPSAIAQAVFTHEIMQDAQAFALGLRELTIVAREHQQTAPLPGEEES